MPKTIQQLRSLDAEELSARDLVALVALAGFVANPVVAQQGSERKQLVELSFALADEFMLHRESEVAS